MINLTHIISLFFCADILKITNRFHSFLIQAFSGGNYLTVLASIIVFGILIITLFTFIRFKGSISTWVYKFSLGATLRGFFNLIFTNKAGFSHTPITSVSKTIIAIITFFVLFWLISTIPTLEVTNASLIESILAKPSLLNLTPSTTITCLIVFIITLL